MQSQFKVHLPEVNQYVEYDITRFPCGELQVKLRNPDYIAGKSCSILARIKDSEGLMVLAQLKACIDLWNPKETSLALAYIPYARQDRICNRGECHSLKLFANMINAMNFGQVALFDPHSDVAEPLFDNSISISKGYIFELMKVEFRDVEVLIAPDAGATKEVQALAIDFGLDFAQGMKKRDPVTGDLCGFELYGDIKGRNVLVVDDLCDGGGTFLGLGDIIRDHKPESMGLYITHGCFTKGTEALEEMYNKVYTTNTFRTDLEDSDTLKVFKLFKD